MREIKFRVWNKVLKKFDPAGLPIMHNSEKGIFGVDNSYVEHFVVQQYTGLKDKNGVEIYEGDVIDNHEEYHNKKVVNYDPHSCFFCLIDFDDWPDIMYNGEMFNQAGEGSNFSGRIEVIGNIFEGVDK
jgi:uncharacterized phage protein (TIGR01671 family)